MSGYVLDSSLKEDGISQIVWVQLMENVKITPPQGCGSYFWNHKSFNSLVLMAIANANYEFIYYDIGTKFRMEG
jgi:hypothetical protein